MDNEYEQEIPSAVMANIIEILRKVGWSAEQINAFILGFCGGLSIEETVEEIKNG